MTLQFFKPIKGNLFTIILILLSFVTAAQNSGDVEQVFGGIPSGFQGFDVAVYKIVVQPDGKKIIGGNFNSYNGTGENRIIRLNTDGTKDTSFNTGNGFNGYVYAITLMPNGKIILGGDFTTYNGVSANRIVRLNADGTKDSTFNVGVGFNEPVNAVGLQSDGKIIVGGEFTSYNGTPQNRIIRLNNDGTKDAIFNVGGGFNDAVMTMAVQQDNKIIIGGNFTSYKGVTENSIIRVNANGTKDAQFNNVVGFNGNVISVALQPNGKMIIAGSFTTYKGVNENRIVRLNVDGTKDTSFNTTTGFNNTVLSVAVQSDDKVVVGGYFTSYKSITENRIIRLNTDGSKDITFNTGVGFNNVVSAIALESDGKMSVGGHFTAYKNAPVTRVIHLNSDGTKDEGGFNNDVTALALQSDGKTIVGGSFTAYKGITENRIIRLNPDATKDSSFNTGTGFAGSVFTTTLQPDGKIIAGGYFSSYKGVTENSIIRLNTDGTKDISFNTGTGFNNAVNATAVQSNGKIIVGGWFTSYKGLTQNNIIRLNLDGTKDTSFNIGSGFNSPVEAIAIQADGKIIVAGQFTSFNGATANRIIRLNSDGSKDVSFNVGTGFDNSVYVATLQPDGKIIIGGNFNSYKGLVEQAIIRLNPDGTKDVSFNTGTGFNSNIYSATLQSNGKIIIGGDFTIFDGFPQNHIVRLNSDGIKDSSFITGTGFNNYVNTIAVNSDGKIAVAGHFTSYNTNNSSAYLITLHGDVSLSNEDFLEKNTIALRPNPVQSILHISNLDATVRSVQIYNLQGKSVYENADFVASIDVSSLASGIYVVHVQTEIGKIIKKIIKS